jgi:predicted aldo/keto reductase-like oxidoreductase
MDKKLNRREILEVVAAASLTAMGASAAASEVPYRTLGTTSEKVSCIGLGGAHIGRQKDEADSIRIIRTAVDRGINFLDNCWDYNDGNSEIRMGKALRDGYRQKVFLMTKIDGRTKASAAKQIDESLQRLQTDHIDLMQFHENIRLEDPDRFFAPGGTAEAFEEAKKAGKIRYVGFTGHKDPYVHLRMFEMARKHNYHFDTIQMPLNVMDAHFRSFAKEVIPVALSAGAGVLGMKPIGGGIILQSKTVTAVECLRYALNLPTSVVITGCDKLEILDQAIDTAKNFKPLGKQELSDLLAKVAPMAGEGKYELFKTKTRFDGTAKNPQWMG